MPDFISLRCSFLVAWGHDGNPRRDFSGHRRWRLYLRLLGPVLRRHWRNLTDRRASSAKSRAPRHAQVAAVEKDQTKKSETKAHPALVCPLKKLRRQRVALRRGVAVPMHDNFLRVLAHSRDAPAPFRPVYLAWRALRRLDVELHSSFRQPDRHAAFEPITHDGEITLLR